MYSLGSWVFLYLFKHAMWVLVEKSRKFPSVWMVTLWILFYRTDFEVSNLMTLSEELSRGMRVINNRISLLSNQLNHQHCASAWLNVHLDR